MLTWVVLIWLTWDSFENYKICKLYIKKKHFLSTYVTSNSRQVLANNLNIKSIFNTAEYINNDENVQIHYTEENFNKLIDIKSSPKNKLIKKQH